MDDREREAGPQVIAVRSFVAVGKASELLNQAHQSLLGAMAITPAGMDMVRAIGQIGESLVKVRAAHTQMITDALDAAAERDSRPTVCFDCHRPARDMTRCADGEWRGPKCTKDYEAGAGQQLPIEGGKP